MSSLSAAYVAWARDNGVRPLGPKRRAKILDSMGFARGQTKREGRIWFGIGLAAPEGPPPEAAQKEMPL